MSKANGFWDSAAIWPVSIVLGFVALAFTQSIFNLFFVPIVVAVLWNCTDKIRRLEKRLSEIEAKLSVGQLGEGIEVKPSSPS